MNTAYQTELENRKTAVELEQKVYQHLLDIRPLCDTLSDTATFNFNGGSLWFMVDNREDLQKLMTLAPKWDKYTDQQSAVMVYGATINGVYHSLRARSAALPASCHEVEEDQVIPATEAKTIRVKRIVCNLGTAS